MGLFHQVFPFCFLFLASVLFFYLETDHKEIVIHFTLMLKIFTEKLWSKYKEIVIIYISMIKLKKLILIIAFYLKKNMIVIDYFML